VKAYCFIKDNIFLLVMDIMDVMMDIADMAIQVGGAREGQLFVLKI
jgi:hypothetical protein